jgi:hypothetical protein
VPGWQGAQAILNEIKELYQDWLGGKITLQEYSDKLNALRVSLGQTPHSLSATIYFAVKIGMPKHDMDTRDSAGTRMTETFAALEVKVQDRFTEERKVHEKFKKMGGPRCHKDGEKWSRQSAREQRQLLGIGPKATEWFWFTADQLIGVLLFAISELD